MKKTIFGSLVLTLPMFVFAQIPTADPNLGNVEILIRSISYLIGLLLPIVVAIALLFFFWGLAQFIFNSDNEDARAVGKQRMIWGVVALFVMVSVWGLVGFIGQALGIGQGQDLYNTPGIMNLPGYTPHY